MVNLIWTFKLPVILAKFVSTIAIVETKSLKNPTANLKLLKARVGQTTARNNLL